MRLRSLLIVVFSASAFAQWSDLKTPGIPRMPNGKVNLTAPAPRTADGKPDLNGVWEHPFVPDMTKDDVNQKGEPQLPFTQWGANEWKTYDAANGDYTGACLPFGLTRSINSPYPIQIVQTPQQIVVLYEYMNVFRVIYMNAKHRDDVDSTYMGDSVAHWEGDTLVVDVTQLNPQTWLDASGNHFSADAHLVERFTRTGADTLQYEATYDDSKTYTRPWTMRVTLHRRTEPNVRVLEYDCNAYMEFEGGK